MQLMRLLHNTFEKQLPGVHKTRLNNLMKASETLIRVNKLSLTALGRNLSEQNKPRSNIKKMDRLVGNKHLQDESILFYKSMTASLINEGSCPWIHIDWSCICSLTKLYFLRASLSMSGRSIVIYEECHPKKNENNHSVHKAFLQRLKNVLPPLVKPVIVTDAGFRALWFSEVLKMGWDFVGRLRNKNLICLANTDDWQLSKSLYQGANAKAKKLGRAILTEKLQVPVNLVLYKGKKKNRHKLKQNKKNSKCGRSKRYAKAHKEPWLLVTSLVTSAQETVKMYHQRMRIEENIRDTKCARFGFGLKESRTHSSERMKILLLIAAIATFACWVAALVTRQNGTASDYQAHSSKFKSVISSVYLGREALKRGINITGKKFSIFIQLLFDIVNYQKLEDTACS